MDEATDKVLRLAKPYERMEHGREEMVRGYESRRAAGKLADAVFGKSGSSDAERMLPVDTSKVAAAQARADDARAHLDAAHGHLSEAVDRLKKFMDSSDETRDPLYSAGEAHRLGQRVKDYMEQDRGNTSEVVRGLAAMGGVSVPDPKRAGDDPGQLRGASDEALQHELAAIRAGRTRGDKGMASVYDAREHAVQDEIDRREMATVHHHAAEAHRHLAAVRKALRPPSDGDKSAFDLYEPLIPMPRA